MEDIRESITMGEQDEAQGLKKARKHFSRIGWMFVLGTVVIYAVQLVPVILVRMFRPRWLLNDNIALLISTLPMYLIGMPVLILLMRRIPAKLPERHTMKTGSIIVAAIMCLSLVYVFNVLGNILTTIIGALKGGMVQNELLNLTEGLDLWMIFFIMVICAPIMEELIFRKIIVDRTIHYGQGAAVMVSGLMFGLFHGNLNQFVYAFVLGMFLAFLYAKTGNLKITIGLHMLINFLGGVVSSLLMRMIDIDEYLGLASEGMDMEVMMSYFMDNLAGWIIYLCYAVFIIGIMISGTILFIVFMAKKKFTLSRGTFVIPKGKRFRTVILNAGMLVYCVIWTATIAAQLFM